MRRLLVLLAVLAGPVWAAPPDVSGIEYDQRLGAALPLEARFVDQAGTATTLRDMLRGRPVLLQLGYFHCPALCGPTRDDLFAALAASGLRAGADYALVFISIDPAETPADAAPALADTLQRYPLPGDAGAIHFLTGPAEAVEQAVGFRSRFEPALKQFLHPSGVVLLTPEGRVSSYLLGIGYSGDDVRAGVVRAGQGGVARAAIPVLLLCFHYDEVTGQYTLAVMKVLRLAAVLTVLGGAAVLLALRRAERRA